MDAYRSNLSIYTKYINQFALKENYAVIPQKQIRKCYMTSNLGCISFLTRETSGSCGHNCVVKKHIRVSRHYPVNVNFEKCSLLKQRQLSSTPSQCEFKLSQGNTTFKSYEVDLFAWHRCLNVFKPCNHITLNNRIQGVSLGVNEKVDPSLGHQ